MSGWWRVARQLWAQRAVGAVGAVEVALVS